MSNQTAWVVGFVEFATTHREGAAYFPQLANTCLKSGRFFKNDENADRTPFIARISCFQ